VADKNRPRKGLMAGSAKDLAEIKGKLQDLGMSMKDMKSQDDILSAMAKWKRTFGQGKMAYGGKTKKKMAGGGKTFPDLTGDGKVTQADILKGRGVFAYGGKAKKKKKMMGGGKVHKKMYAKGGGIRKAKTYG
jgi:hypothetical protein